VTFGTDQKRTFNFLSFNQNSLIVFFKTTQSFNIEHRAFRALLFYGTPVVLEYPAPQQLYTTKHFYKEENGFNPQAQSDPRGNCSIQSIAIRKLRVHPPHDSGTKNKNVPLPCCLQYNR
jgi:hypothetical protein